MKKAKLRPILSFVIAAVMLCAVASPVFAAEPPMPLPPETGDLVIHKYIGAPTGGMADGTEQDTTSWTDVIPVNGVQFDLYKIGAPTDTGYPTVPPLGAYFLSGGVVEVYDGDTLIAAYAATAAGSVTTATDGTATAADLSQGVYFVTENVAASGAITNADTGDPMFISEAVVPFLVAVPMTNSTGDGWITEVHVYPKNEAMSIQKEVDVADGDAVAVGDEISYTITASVPGDIADGKKFEIIDILDEALDIDLASIEVYAQPSDTLLSKDEGEGDGGDYTVTYNESDGKLTIAFTAEGRAALEGKSSVQLIFTTTVNKKILEYADLTVGNDASVAFRNSDDVDFDADTNDEGPRIHTAAIRITKVDEAARALNGAKFKIASSKANADSSYFLRIDPATSEIADYDPTPGSKWLTLGAANDYEIAPANVAAFTGLRDKVAGAWNTYWVVETKAPSGYNLIGATIEVAFDGTEMDYMYLLTVHNSKGFTLPQTGGMGVILFTVAGIALLGVALILVITSKKRKLSYSKDELE